VFPAPHLNRPQLANVIEDRGFRNKAADETPDLACHIRGRINDAGCGNRCLDPAILRPNNRQQLHLDRPKTLPRHQRAGNGVDDSTIRVCPGTAGYVVLISEDDLRESVSVGRNRLGASREPAARSSFGPFNSTTNTVEWRGVAGKPFAIIQRWHIADNADQDKDGRSPNRCWR
jgi:hypothetical protein